MKRCEICFSEENLQKHHIDYESDETITLCASCHSTIHHGAGLDLQEVNWSEFKKDPTLNEIRKYESESSSIRMTPGAKKSLLDKSVLMKLAKRYADAKEGK